MKTRSLFPGITLIVLGILFLLPNVTPLRWHAMWPLFVLGSGVWFFALFAADRQKYGLLMPAAVVTTVGSLLLYCSLTGWSSMEDLWPLFIMAPGLGFLLMYLFGKKEPGLLVPAGVLILFSLFFLVRFSFEEFFVPIVLIGIGVLLLLRGRKRLTPPPTEPPATV